jgi:hypothetical protein
VSPTADPVAVPPTPPSRDASPSEVERYHDQLRRVVRREWQGIPDDASSPEITTPTIDDDPEVATAHTRHMRAREAAVIAEARWRELKAVAQDSTDRLAAARAALLTAQAEAEALAAQADRDEAERSYWAVRGRVQAARRAHFTERQREAVKALTAALDTARAANQTLLALQQEAAAAGCALQNLAWPELAPESPAFSPKFETWRRFVVAHFNGS